MLEMSWSSSAASNAKDWAKTCSMKHSPEDSRTISTSGCGENLYTSNNKETWRDVIGKWENEKQNFIFGERAYDSLPVEQYIQLVWAKSDSIGCYAAYCPDSAKKYFYVCQYCRPGNGTITRPYKAGLSCQDCPDDCEDNLCTNPCSYIDEVPNCVELTREWGCQRKETKHVCRASCQCQDKIY
ncbi:cysteine-rich venom protein-like [Sebastes fasciatus]|uniref:cysteine-rich venom protein-like n=1 Tax=Sebastes fasciatus TaxID=394691 RepID=UPI003D9F400B